MTPDRPYPAFVSDAGLVLLQPYLPSLFERTGVLGEGSVGLVDPAKALAQLEFLVSGALGLSSDPSLRLALCGLTQNITPAPLPDQDREICDGLLAAVIENWPIIHSTSFAGLRETFLQRDGRLDLVDEFGLALMVQRTAYDVLVDQIPWSFNLIKHPWMPSPVSVHW